MITRIPTQHFSFPSAYKTAFCLSRQAPITFKQPPRPSIFLQCQIPRKYSTVPPPPPPPSSQEPSSKPIDLRSQLSTSAPPSYSQPAPKPKRSLRPYIYATLFLLIGATLGHATSLVVAPPPLPPPGSKEDQLMIQHLQSQAENLPIVQTLSTDPAWTSHDAYQAFSPTELAARLTSGPLAGARALGGFQRIFYNKESGEIVTVIWFGGNIAGWPGVVHGGATSTIIDEVLGRCAVKTFPAGTGVTANLEVSYLRPVQTNNFYVIRAVPQAEGRTERKVWVSGRLENLAGAVLVEAKGLFVVPKKYQTRTIAANF